jgi:hypothetical protein
VTATGATLAVVPGPGRAGTAPAAAAAPSVLPGRSAATGGQTAAAPSTPAAAPTTPAATPATPTVSAPAAQAGSADLHEAASVRATGSGSSGLIATAVLAVTGSLLLWVAAARLRRRVRR